jgi:transcriptional regulator with XRE-family HTH domain
MWLNMKIEPLLTDASILAELGERLASLRIQRNLTQAELADQAGVSKRTVERLEAGAVASQLSSFIRVCRVLGLVESLDQCIPSPSESPMTLLKLAGKKRKRASGKRLAPAKPGKWTWAE